MQKAQQGDAIAYRQLLSEITPAIRKFLKARFFSPDMIEDICQETLLAIHTARHTFRPEQPFANWMYGIARFKMIDTLRRQMRQAGNEISDDALVTFMADPANNAEEALAGKELRAAMGQLPEKQRKVLYLTKVEGFSMAETAQKMGMSESAVKVTAHRGYKKLREILVANGYE